MKPTYTNDKKAPRMRKGKFSKSVVTKELWEKFCKDFPEYNLTWREFQDRWADIAQTIREEIVNNPLGVKLGSYTGEIKLQYLPHKFSAPNTDEKVKEEVGGTIPHVNLTTRGKVAKIKWERRWAVKFNKILQFYAFESTREINRMAKQRIDEAPASLRMSRNTLGGSGGLKTWALIKAMSNGK